MPTDTVYGVASLPDRAGLEKIYRAKERDRNKPVPLLASGLEAVRDYGARMNDAELRLAEKFWPGPLTLLLNTDESTEGFRVPDHEMALELLRMAGGVLRVTSANLSGMPPALTAAEAAEALGGSVEVVLDGGPSRNPEPSTVASVESGELKILREGALTRMRLEKVLNEQKK